MNRNASTVVSIADLCTRMTATNNTRTPVTPPPVAARSPLDEVLVAELTATLPAPVARRMAGISRIDQVDQWIVAGVLYKILAAREPSALPQFLDDVERDVSRAPSAWAQALAAAMPVPPRPPRWHRFELAGAALQAAILILVLAVRTTLLLTLAPFPPGEPGNRSLADPESALSVVSGVVALNLPSADHSKAAACFTLISAWLLAEGVLVALSDRVRTVPARLASVAPAIRSRTDLLPLLWAGWVTVVSLSVVQRAGAPGESLCFCAAWLVVAACIWGLVIHEALPKRHRRG